MSSAFDTALTAAQTQMTTYAAAVTPVVGVVALAWLAPSILKRVINRFRS